MSTIELVVFTVPALLESPALGGGCCAVSSAWLIEDSIGQLPGVNEIEANDESGEVRVRFDPERIDAQRIGLALQDLGFTPEVTARPQEAAQMACCME